MKTISMGDLRPNLTTFLQTNEVFAITSLKNVMGYFIKSPSPELLEELEEIARVDEHNKKLKKEES